MPLRIAGLSGFDVDNTVKELMKAHRASYDKLDQRKQTYEWSRDAYRDVNLKITDYRNNKLFNFKLEGTFNKKDVTISGDTEAVSAKATAGALNGNITISVQQLAEAASNYSTSEVTKDGFDLTKPLTEQMDKLAHGTPLAATYKFRINGSEDIVVDPTKDSMNDIIARINQSSNVTAFYDEGKKVVSFMAKQTGLTNGADGKGDKIVFEDKQGNFLNTIMQVATDSANKKTAQDAKVKINGLETTRTSNNFTVNGIEISLKKAGGTAATIEPKTKTDEILESIKTFVSDYNDFLKSVQDKVTEQRDRDFEPLTSEQREAMSEKQIEKWEERAKKGLLRNDPILSKIISNMRMAVTAEVDTGNKDIRSLAMIGIDTGEYFENGKLVIKDEEKLRSAIESDPLAVQALFTQNAEEGRDGSEVGIAERMYAKLKEGLDELVTKAGIPNTSVFDQSTVSTQITQVNKQLDQMERKLRTLEDNYYKKFAAMEAALNRYNSQSAYLANAFGGGGSAQ
ncbi:flagellar filament capping protein FliD [Paenibacillus flagellatus]|uniref:Flagellar hook-associated protein 2 n=1 Tax=Paenibacillus flagellatus TaxID=2211139 RepID=A0A2V5K111_9BACL|nr:flagellar filament capping protein FliD [Paenibacillus flagellatus]PYI51183.1 flagellar cap protein FliD [Paenibacillus flagellatus]